MSASFHNSQQKKQTSKFCELSEFFAKNSEIPGNSLREFLKWRIPGNSREFFPGIPEREFSVALPARSVGHPCLLLFTARCYTGRGIAMASCLSLSACLYVRGPPVASRYRGCMYGWNASRIILRFAQPIT